MDPNLHNFLLSYIYNLNKDKLDKSLVANRKTKKIWRWVRTKVRTRANNTNVNDLASPDYLSNFYKYLDVICDIYDIPIKLEDSEEHKLQAYINLFRILNETIQLYKSILKSESFKPNIYYLDMHGGYCEKELSGKGVNPIICTVPSNFVLIFTTPTNYTSLFNSTSDNHFYILEAFRSLLKTPETIPCLPELDKFRDFEILLPNQKYFNIKLKFDKTSNSNSDMNLYCLYEDKDKDAACIKDTKYNETLNDILSKEIPHRSNLTFLFVSSCRSLNLSLIMLNDSNTNTKTHAQITSKNMYIYHNFMYYYNFNMMECYRTFLIPEALNSKLYNFNYDKNYLFSFKDLWNIDQKIAKHILKKFIIEQYNISKPVDLPVLENDKFKIVFNNNNVYITEINPKNINLKLLKKIKDKIIKNLAKYLHSLQSKDRNNDNKSLGSKGRLGIKEAMAFASLNSSNTPLSKYLKEPHQSYTKLKETSLYETLRRIIKEQPIYSELSKLKFKTEIVYTDTHTVV